jgi:hypothetical protein
MQGSFCQRGGPECERMVAKIDPCHCAIFATILAIANLLTHKLFSHSGKDASFFSDKIRRLDKEKRERDETEKAI